MTLDRWLRVRADGFRFRPGLIPKESRAAIMRRLASKLDGMAARMDGPVPAVDPVALRHRIMALVRPHG